MKVQADLGDVSQLNVIRQEVLNGLAKALWRDARFSPKAGHLAEGMHSRVRASGRQHVDVFSAGLLDGLCDNGLHRESIGLHLPTDIPRAVVSECHAQIASQSRVLLNEHQHE